MVMSPSSIGPSTRSGELVLTTLASPGRRRISASSRPRLSRLISKPSTTRSAPMQLGPQILSVRVVCRKWPSRWRVGTGTSMGAMGNPTSPCRMLRLWASLMKLARSAKFPGRRPRSRSAQLGGPEVRMKLTLFSPMRRSWAGLRAWSVKLRGALATCSSTSPRSRRTRLLARSTAAPWADRMPSASAFRTSMPKFSRIRIEASWMRSSCSGSMTSMGAKGLAIWRQGGCGTPVMAHSAISPLSRREAKRGRRRLRPDDERQPRQDDGPAEELHRRDVLAEHDAAGDDTGDGHQQGEGNHLIDAVAPEQSVPEGIGDDEAAEGEAQEDGPEPQARRGDGFDLAMLEEQRGDEGLRDGADGDPRRQGGTV